MPLKFDTYTHQGHPHFKIIKHEKLHYQSYNGGISEAQLRWLEGVLERAQSSNENVIISGHLPIHMGSCRADAFLYNHQALVELFERYSCVNVYLAGHDHGNN